MSVRLGSLLFATLSLLGATACPGSGGGGAPPFRSGTREIHRARATDAEMAATCLFFEDQCNEEHVGVGDVARDGDRLAVIVSLRLGRTTSRRLLAQSEDLGQTWTSRELSGLEGTIDSAVHLAAGKTWILYLRSDDGVSGHEVWHARFEPDTGGAHLRMGVGPIDLAGTKATQAWSYVQTPYTSMGWDQYDLSTLQRTGGQTLTPTAELPYVAGGDWRSTDGVHYRGFTRRTLGTTHEYCQLDMTVGTDALQARCVPRLSWPLPLDQYFAARNLVASGSVWEVQEVLGGVWAATFLGEPAQASPPQWLGAGTLAPLGDSVHSRFGGYLLLQSAVQRLRTVGAEGALEIDLPALACDQAPCGFGPNDRFFDQLQWATPLSGDEWLLFHVVDLSDEGNEEVLVASRARVAPRRAQLTPPPRSPIPALPDATPPLTPLERSCAFAAGCNQAEASTVYPCVRAWMPVCGVDSEHDVQWQARLAAPQDCAALGPPVPQCVKDLGQVSADQCTGCDAQGRLVSCRQQGDFFFATRQDCAGLGLQCMTPQVLDYVPPPARPICTPGICPMSRDLVQCDGSIAFGCYGELMSELRDCSRAGMACVPGTGCTLGPAMTCPDELSDPACHGDLAPYCFEGRTRYLECRAMGFAGCDQGRCVR
ncbi:MAG: hypothetical protein QM765_35455 [Myxococcales bacterium]